MIDLILGCLALNIYWEARNQPVEGQVAVTQVVLNRVMDERYPSSACAVIRQGKHTNMGMPLKHQCQFSWYCDGKSDVPIEADAFRWALSIANQVMNGVWPDITDGSTHYHADNINPNWPDTLTFTKKIGNHIFYRRELD